MPVIAEFLYFDGDLGVGEKRFCKRKIVECWLPIVRQPTGTHIATRARILRANISEQITFL
jgi:hypothetical protein